MDNCMQKVAFARSASSGTPCSRLPLRRSSPKVEPIASKYRIRAGMPHSLAICVTELWVWYHKPGRSVDLLCLTFSFCELTRPDSEQRMIDHIFQAVAQQPFTNFGGEHCFVRRVCRG